MHPCTTYLFTHTSTVYMDRVCTRTLLRTVLEWMFFWSPDSTSPPPFRHTYTTPDTHRCAPDPTPTSRVTTLVLSPFFSLLCLLGLYLYSFDLFRPPRLSLGTSGPPPPPSGRGGGTGSGRGARTSGGLKAPDARVACRRPPHQSWAVRLNDRERRAARRR